MMEEIVLEKGGQYLFISLCLFFILKKHIYSFFDPLVLIILSLSSGLVLAINSSIFSYVLYSIISFLIGFLLIVRKNKSEKFDDSIKIIITRDFEFLVTLFALIFIAANSYIFATSGIPFLMENPTEAKVVGFDSGNGWIRRILFQSSFVLISLLFIFIQKNGKCKRTLVMLIIFFFLSILNGSKSSLLTFISVLVFFLSQKKYWTPLNYQIREKVKKTIPFVLIIAVLVFLLIASKESEVENQDLQYSIGFRMMEFGDVMLYYEDEYVQKYFKTFGVIDFFRYEFNGILGVLRMDDYLLPLGYQMANEYWAGFIGSDVITGPNTLFFVRGHIFFGYFGGIIYSFIIGFLFGKLRMRLFQFNSHNPLKIIVSVYLFFLLPLFLKEFNFAVSLFFDLFVMITLLWIIVKIMVFPKILNT